jgi:O-antigen/teichoic acid export membrane protein
VQNAIKVMAAIIALRWISGLYRAAICGFERLVWLGGFNIAIASARFVLVIPFFIYGFTSPTQFFCYQLVLALFEVIFLVIKTYRLLPPPGAINHTPWQWTPLRGMLKFSLSIAFTGSVWVLVTQTDKLVLSKLLPLSEYAYFTMAVLVAGGVSLISGPASGALLPRLAKLAAEGDEVGMIRLYRNATQLVGVIAIPAALMLAFFAEQVLWAWTGSVDIALKASPVLTLYALGNGILALGAFPYYLQFAKGDLRLHMIGNAVFVLVLIPALIWATEKYGGEGAGYVWLGLNIFLFVAWSPIVHHKFAPGLNLKWYKEDVLVILIPTLAVGFCFSLSDFNHLSSSRLMQFIKIILIGLVLLMTSIVASSVVREKLKKYLNLLLVKIKWQKQ